MIHWYQNCVRKLSNILNYMAMVMLFLLMTLCATEVIGRYIFNRPITAVTELGQIMQAVMFFLAWAYTTYTKGHVRVTLFVSRLSLRAQAIMDFVIILILVLLFSLITWQGIETAVRYWKTNMLVDVLFIPLAPFQLFVSIGAAAVCLVLIGDIVEILPRMKRRD